MKRLEGTVAIGCVLDSKKTGDSVSNENWRTASVIWFSSSPNQINVISPWSSIFTRLQASNTSIASVLRMLFFDEPQVVAEPSYCGTAEGGDIEGVTRAVGAEGEKGVEGVGGDGGFEGGQVLEGVGGRE